MAEEIELRHLRDKNGKKIAPFAPEAAIYDEKGMRLSDKLKGLNLNSIREAQDEALSAIDEKENEAIGNFSSQRVIPDMLSPEVMALIEASGGGTINNMPDGEDLTSKDIAGGKSVMQLADRPYNPSAFSGKGYTILRKNVSALSRGGSSNILTQDMISQPNTVYEIRYDFDLNGAEITVPERCVLKFIGGTFNNGKLSGSVLINADKEVLFKNISIDQLIIEGDCYSDWFYGVENDNILLNNIINSGAKYIQLKKTVYNISHKILLDEKYKLPNFGAGIIVKNFKSNINFNHATFKLVPTNDSHFSIMYITNSSNALVKELNIIGDKNEHLVDTGQWSYGIGITHDCKNISINNCNISECYGDCICIENNLRSEDGYQRAENITITNNFLGNCLRNNISSVGVKNLLIQNNIITRIDSAPNSTDCNAQLFIDIESNYDNQSQDDVQILNNYCYCNKLGVHDCSGGISVRGVSYNNNIIIAENKIFNCWYYGINVGSLNSNASIQILNNFISNIDQESIIVGNNIFPYIANNTITEAGVGIYNEKTTISNNTYSRIKARIVKKGIFSNCLFKDSNTTNKILFENSELYDCKFINIRNENIDTIDLGYCVALDNSILSNITFVNCSGYCVLNQYGGDTNFSSIKFYNCRNKVATYYNTTAKNININDIEFVNCERYNILCLKNDDTERRVFINHVVIKDSVEDTTKQTRYLSICDGQILSIENFVVSDIYISPSNYYKQINSGDYIVAGNSAKCHNITICNASDQQKIPFYNVFNENEADEIYFNGEKIIGTSLTLSSLSDKLFAKNILTNKFYKEGNRTPKVPIWNISEDGVTPKWIDALGNPPDAQRAGTFSQKPSNIAYGFPYYCTDRKTTEGNRNGIMIYYAGADTWVDALGRVVE